MSWVITHNPRTICGIGMNGLPKYDYYGSLAGPNGSLNVAKPASSAALAAAGGWAYRRATTRAELDDALTAPEPLLLVEVPLEP